jgi:hypothetical protein
MGLALLLRPARPVVCDRLGNRTAPYDSARPIRFAEVVIDGDSFFIGRSLYAADAYLNASIDEFRIYDSALSAEQVKKDYSAGPDSVERRRADAHA